MQQTTRPAVKKRRPGIRRMMTHIIVFALLGSVLLGLGLYGYQTLERRTLDQKQTARIEAHLNASVKEAQDLSQSAVSDSGSDVKIGIDSRKRRLKEDITASVTSGLDDQVIALSSIDTLLGGIINRVGDDDKKEAITAASTQSRDELAGRVVSQVDAAEEAMGIASARLSLMVTEPDYALMYFYMPLIAAGSFCLLFSAALLSLWLRYDERKRARVGELLEPVDYLLPFFIGVALFTLYPMVRVIIMSFQERYKLEGSFTGWGLGNYEYVIKGIPGTTNYFLQGLRNTFLYVLYTVPISTALAIIIAYLLNQKLRLSSLFQTSYFLPMVTSVTAVGLVWRALLLWMLLLLLLGLASVVGA